MSLYFVDLFDEVKLPWGAEISEAHGELLDSGFLDIEKGPDYLQFTHQHDIHEYEVHLSFPENSHFTLRSSIIRLNNVEEGVSKTKNAIRNFRSSYRLLKKRLGEPLEMNDFDPDDSPVALLENLRDEIFPEIIWDTPEKRVLLEIEDSIPFMTVVRTYCSLPIKNTEKKNLPQDILSLVKNMNISIESHRESHRESQRDTQKDSNPENGDFGD